MKKDTEISSFKTICDMNIHNDAKKIYIKLVDSPVINEGRELLPKFKFTIVYPSYH